MSFPCVDRIYEGENQTTGLVYLDPYLYVLYYGGWPTWSPSVHKIDPETYEKIGEWIAPGDAAMAMGICTDCEHVYVGTSNTGTTGHHWPSHVFKIDTETMTTIASFQGYGTTGDSSIRSIRFDFKTERLIALDDRYLYRTYKLRQDLTEEMHKDAESGYHPSQFNGYDLTILDDHFYVTTGGVPGEIVKRRISDLEMVDYFSGYLEEPDCDIEGLFFNICNDGEFLYVATYDYDEYRPTRLIKIKPSDMSRWSTYYGQSDELLAYGSYHYNGKIYMLLYGWNGIYWGEPGYERGEVILQIDASAMTETDRYVNWTGECNDAFRAVGDGSRLHVGFWGDEGVNRSVLQFAEEGAPDCIPWVGKKVILSSSKDKYFVEKIRATGIGDVGMLINAPSQKCFLPKVSIKAGDSCKITSFKDRHFARKI